MRNTNPIFIVGAPRSGTTLLQYMLRSHPNIALPTGESHFFIPLLRDVKNFGDLTERDGILNVLLEMYRRSKHFLDTDMHGIKFDADALAREFFAEKRNSVPSIISALYEKNAAGEGKERWGDKTPYYVLHMSTLLEKFPGAQFIHVIRDGRDCALSMVNRKHDFHVYNMYCAAKYWEIYVEMGRRTGQKLDDSTYHEIFYEDLLEKPTIIMKTACDFLNEPFSETVVNYKKSGEKGKTPLLQKPIQKDNREKWRKNMSSRQVSIFESAVGNTLTQCGYKLATDAKPPSLVEKAYWRFHNNAINRYYKTMRVN